MRLRKAKELALTLLIAAGMGVTGPAAAGQASKSAKPHSVKHRSSAHHGKSHRYSSRRRRGQKTPTADRISEIQSALAKDGSFSGTPNGKWDAATVDAMKKFQDSHGLNPTGKLDARTLQKLGLGSQTAGVAPPLPPVTSTSIEAGPSPIAQRQP